jgi:hypothetical protein
MAARSERDLGVIQFEAYAVMFEERLNRPAASAFYGSPLRSYRRAARVHRPDAGMNIGAVLAQTAQKGGPGIARRSDVYIALVGAPVGVHVTVDVLVGWPQIRGRGRHPLRGSGRLVSQRYGFDVPMNYIEGGWLYACLLA